MLQGEQSTIFIYFAYYTNTSRHGYDIRVCEIIGKYARMNIYTYFPMEVSVT